MIRKLLIVLIFTFTFGAPWAIGLGLGAIEVHSSLRQPLDAQIKLYQVQGFKANEIQPYLASKKNFDLASIQRPFFLGKLQFRTVLNNGGKSYIKITSSDPIAEPFINFILEVRWPNGRMLKEYTLLIDPPKKIVRLPTVKMLAEMKAAKIKQSDLKSKYLAQKNYKKPLRARKGRATYRVHENEPLWNIAKNVAMPKSGHYTIQQVMLAVQTINPDAFINNNINLLKKGSRLKLPYEAEVARLIHQQVVGEVSRQNRDWGGMIVDMRKTLHKKAKMAKVISKADHLKIVDKKQGGQDEKKESKSTRQSTEEKLFRLDNKFTMDAEQTDKHQHENAELKARLEALSEQISILEQLVSLENGQLSKIQEQLRLTQGWEVGSIRQAKVPKQEVRITQDQASKSALEHQRSIVSQKATNLIKNQKKQNLNALTQEEQLSKTVGQATPATTPVPIEQKIANKEVNLKEKPKAKSWLAVLSLLNQWTFLLGLTGVSVILIIFFIQRQRKLNEVVENYGEDELDTIIKRDMLADAIANRYENNNTSIKLETDSDKKLEIEKVEESDDSLRDVEIYISYGRYEQAIKVLEDELKAHPEKEELHLKLLKIMVETVDKQGFAEHFSKLVNSEDKNLVKKAQALDEQMNRKSSGYTDETEALEKDLNLDELGLDNTEVDPDLLIPSDDFEKLEIDGMDELSIEQQKEQNFSLFDGRSKDNTNLSIENTELSVEYEPYEGLYAKDMDKDVSLEDKHIDFSGADEDSVVTKLNLARAYREMEDKESARELLNEVLEEGNEKKKAQAKFMLDELD